VSRLVDRAARRGLVRRREGEEDARVSMIELSPDGERLARKPIATLESQVQPLLEVAVHFWRRLSIEIETSGDPTGLYLRPHRVLWRRNVQRLQCASIGLETGR
jgi:DNA-binding MarR family transcriptional regulator